MINLAPDIFRQRLLIEAFYEIEVNAKVINNYFEEVIKALELRMYGQPTIFSPSGMGKEENPGYDAFVPLINSGISLYIWSTAKFLSTVLYTCKGFDAQIAIDVTQEFFSMTEIECLSF